MRVPDDGGYHYLLPNVLAQGSAPPAGITLPFDVVVLAAEEYQPELPGYIVMHVPLDDGPPPDHVTRMTIRRRARQVADHVSLGRRVLVTCWQGRNRSGVLAGLALVYLGVTPQSAVQRIRILRDGLTNPHFLKMVESGRV